MADIERRSAFSRLLKDYFKPSGNEIIVRTIFMQGVKQMFSGVKTLTPNAFGVSVFFHRLKANLLAEGQLFLEGVRHLNKSWICVVLLGFSIAYVACGNDDNEESKPFLNIDNGRFDVDAILADESGSDTSATPFGSGSLSFDFSGDITGTFSVSGALRSNQTENDGVLAILNVFEDEEFDTINEQLSLLGFHPTGDGKTDVFLLGSKTDLPLSSIEPGNSYGIGPSAPFNGLFLNGLDIAEFWAGETNFIETADRAFVITTGIIQIVSRDSLHFTGNFAGTTDINQNALSKHYLVR